MDARFPTPGLALEMVRLAFALASKQQLDAMDPSTFLNATLSDLVADMKAGGSGARASVEVFVKKHLGVEVISGTLVDAIHEQSIINTQASHLRSKYRQRASFVGSNRQFLKECGDGEL